MEDWMVPLATFLQEQLPIFQNGSQWVINQVKWVVMAAIVVLALQAWFQGKTMTVFGTILVGVIIMMFATTDSQFVDAISDSVSGILGLPK